MVPREVLRRMGELGFLGIRIPAEYGGTGMDSLGTVAFGEELARCTYGGVTITALVHIDMASPHIVRAELAENLRAAGGRRQFIPSVRVPGDDGVRSVPQPVLQGLDLGDVMRILRRLGAFQKIGAFDVCAWIGGVRHTGVYSASFSLVLAYALCRWGSGRGWRSRPVSPSVPAEPGRPPWRRR